MAVDFLPLICTARVVPRDVEKFGETVDTHAKRVVEQRKNFTRRYIYPIRSV